MTKYDTTKEKCQKLISGVCEGCGGELEPIETVTNSGKPTFWVGCKHCECLRSGTKKIYWEIARQLIIENRLVPYSFMCRDDYEKSPKWEYYLDTQTAGLSSYIAYIHNLLKEKEAL